MRKVLILVNLQEEWCDPNSDFFLEDMENYIEMVNELIDFCRRKDFRIIFIRHTENEGDFFREKNLNSRIIAEINKEENDEVILKNKISPFYETGLEKAIRKEESIVVAGLPTNLCVKSLVFDAYDRDFNIEVITDCCRSFDENRHEAALEDIKETRPEVELLGLDEFLKT